MTDHLPILLLLLPLFGSLICVLLGRNNAAHSWVVAMISLGGSALLSLLMLIKVLGLKSGDFRYRIVFVSIISTNLQTHYELSEPCCLLIL